MAVFRLDADVVAIVNGDELEDDGGGLGHPSKALVFSPEGGSQ